MMVSLHDAEFLAHTEQHPCAHTAAGIGVRMLLVSRQGSGTPQAFLHERIGILSVLKPPYSQKFLSHLLSTVFFKSCSHYFYLL